MHNRISCASFPCKRLLLVPQNVHIWERMNRRPSWDFILILSCQSSPLYLSAPLSPLLHSLSLLLFHQTRVHKLSLFHILSSLQTRTCSHIVLKFKESETATCQLTGPLQSDKFWCKSLAAARFWWSVPVGSQERERRQRGAVWLSSGETRAHTARECEWESMRSASLAWMNPAFWGDAGYR